MDYNQDNVDEAVLALLYLSLFEDHGVARAWKSHDWDALGRLHQKGWIADPKSKAKSVMVTEAGKQKAKELFEKLFGKPA